MSSIIETERLVLRAWKTDDRAESESVFRYASDPEIGPRCGWPPHTSVEDSMSVINNVLAVDGNWAITIKDCGEPVGSIALKPVSHYTADPIAADAGLEAKHGGALHNAKELGYWIGRPFWGKGYMPEALNAVLAFAFGTLHADAVWGGHYVANPQSGRVMEKCGMTAVCTTKRDYFPLIDEYHDGVVRLITATQWCAAK